MKNILFINACVRSDSRTKRLADALIKRLTECFQHNGGSRVREIVLKEEERGLMPLHDLDIKRRDRDTQKKSFDLPEYFFAQEFAAADIIVIAAPYWDLSFPAVLKMYLEHISVNGVTFRYKETGEPEGLCHAEMLYYVMTAGGKVGSLNLGYEYVKALTKKLFGVKDTQCIGAVELDVNGVDAESALKKTERAISEMQLPDYHAALNQNAK